MPHDRFFLDAPLTKRVALTGPELHHLSHVMRLKTGDTIELVNGKGSLATAEILSISKQRAELEILSSSDTLIPPPRLILAIPLLRPSKLELILEKCTELGADAFWIYPAAHSDKDTLSEHQLERLQYVTISAMKQCGRLDLPPITLLPKFEAIFQHKATFLYGDPRASLGAIPSFEQAIFITGPESGFSEKEMKVLKEKGVAVRLNRHILRAETAPIAAAAILH